MSLIEHLPKIDDRTYGDIVDEARTRIARYAPEWTPVWTDLNHSDPGITLVQTFSWLTEMLVYRLGKVPEANYLKFLELLGIELKPAAPALTEITFPVLDNHPEPTVAIPERTQVSATAAPGEPPIVFETQRPLIALAARLAAVQSFDGYAFSDLTAGNDSADLGFEPFGPLAAADSALLLGFDWSQDFPRTQLELAFWTAGEEDGGSVLDCGLPALAAYPSATLAWEFWNGSSWQAMSVLRDETVALTRSGHVFVKTPKKGEMVHAALGSLADQYYWIRARLARSAYERSPRLVAVRTNTVPAEQAETARHEVLGGSEGRPHQTFQTANAPVLAGSLSLEVDEGSGFETWEPVDDFFASGPEDRHYVLNRTTGEIRFGDGRHGAIPVANVLNPSANVVAREYRFGGGRAGNVAAGQISGVLSSIAGIDEGGVGNLRPAFGGLDEETLAEAKLRAPQLLKSRCRAVSTEDFEHLARQAAAIERARALPLHHPDFPGVKVPGVVTVIVVPESDSDRPMPSAGTLRTVCEYLEQRRLLTTELYVVAPTYLPVSVDVELVADRHADLLRVRQEVEAALDGYFHALTGGDDGRGWPFGGDVYYSHVYQRVLAVEGVERIARLQVSVDRIVTPECTDVCVPDGVLLYSTEHSIEIDYDFEAS